MGPLERLSMDGTNCFMSLFRSLKPVICKVQGAAIGGGSDMALCCDFVIMEDTAKIGYPPARVWGCPTTYMWVYRLGIEKAKRMLLTGDIIDGKEAESIGLIHKSVPSGQLDVAVNNLAEKLSMIPKNQLMMQKMVINQTLENMGLASTQRLATVMDGIARHTPEGVQFKKDCEREGWKNVVLRRDSNTTSSKQEVQKSKL